MLTLVLSLGYDRIVQRHISYFLSTDDRFRAQIAGLVANRVTGIEIEDDMSYHSFVIHSLVLN
jgi:hypothetical protein